jgi:hypothetical protein
MYDHRDAGFTVTEIGQFGQPASQSAEARSASFEIINVQFGPARRLLNPKVAKAQVDRNKLFTS